MPAMRADERPQSILVGAHGTAHRAHRRAMLQPNQIHRGTPSLSSAARRSARRLSKLLSRIASRATNTMS